MRGIFLFLFCGFAICLAGQRISPNLLVRLGGIYGGPLPNQPSIDSTAGKPVLGPIAALALQQKISRAFSVEVGLQYSFKGASYFQLLRRDTLVELELIPGVKDTIPTFYTAAVNGRMTFHQLEIPVLAQAKMGRHFFAVAGLSPSFSVAQTDTGNVHIVIGEGGFFEDVDSTYDNDALLRKWGVVATLGGGFESDLGWRIELRAHRSLTGLYDPAFFNSQGMPGLNLFHTQVSLTAGWNFSSKERKAARSTEP
jgi:hypothetical protein